MAGYRHGTARWLAAFLLLALAAVVTAFWAIREERSPRTEAAPPAGAAAAAAHAGGGAPHARLHVTPPVSGRVTLAPLPSDGVAVTVEGPARLEERAGDADAFHVAPEGVAGAITIALSRAAAWRIDLDPDAETVRLALDELSVDTLRAGAPTGALEGTLPRAGHVELATGGGRTSLHAKSGSRLDTDLALGSGAFVLHVDPGVTGSVSLVAGAGPATLIVDAAVTVALRLLSPAPPLALEGTWWRHVDDDGVTWVRAPVPSAPADAELALVVRSHLGAPLAVTYR